MVPPVPIPNTVVKHSYAESTCLETDWEDRALPVKPKAPYGVLVSYTNFAQMNKPSITGLICLSGYYFKQA